jgi:hypothetical protein
MWKKIVSNVLWYANHVWEKYWIVLDIVENFNDVLHHIWFIEHKIEFEYITFHFYGHTYIILQYKRCTITSALS